MGESMEHRALASLSLSPTLLCPERVYDSPKCSNNKFSSRRNEVSVTREWDTWSKLAWWKKLFRSQTLGAKRHQRCQLARTDSDTIVRERKMATSPLRIYSLADLSDNHRPKRQMSAIATPWRQSSLAPDLLNEWVVSLISSPASKRASFLTQRKTEEYDISNTLVSVAQAPCCAPKRPNHSNTVPLLITTFCSMPPLVCPKQSVTLPAAKKMSDHRNCSASPTRNKPEKQMQMRMPNGARLSANAATIIAVSSSGGAAGACCGGCKLPHTSNTRQAVLYRTRGFILPKADRT